MATVELKFPNHRYDVRIETGALSRFGDWLRQVVPHQRAALLADANVFNEHAMLARQSLVAAGYHVVAHSVPISEDHKNIDTLKSLYEVLIEAHMERKSPVIALGGGVIGDTVGFVAATYLRGVPFIQCPTTLLAMVDASIGGKVGVNLPQGKNLVGAFWQPSMVVIDTECLSTLPTRELCCGLAECVKHAVIRDADLFAWIESNLEAIVRLDAATLEQLIERNVSIKANIVMADEKETGERAHLNLGHTFAHAIEATTGYGASNHPGSYHHGEAVALGMVAATRLAIDTGRCHASLLDRLTKLLDRIGLPTQSGTLPDAATLMKAMQLDKKVAAGQVRFVLPDRLGAVSIVSGVPEAAVIAAWKFIGA